MENNNTITISKEEYINLLYSDLQLDYLESCGVDNWSEYSRPISRNEVIDLIKELEQKYNFQKENIEDVFTLFYDFLYKDADYYAYNIDKNKEDDNDLDVREFVIKNLKKDKGE